MAVFGHTKFIWEIKHVLEPHRISHWIYIEVLLHKNVFCIENTIFFLRLQPETNSLLILLQIHQETKHVGLSQESWQVFMLWFGPNTT